MEHLGRLVITHTMMMKDKWQMQMVKMTPRERFPNFVMKILTSGKCLKVPAHIQAQSGSLGGTTPAPKSFQNLVTPVQIGKCKRQSFTIGSVSIREQR